MKAQEFIIQKLNTLVREFPELKAVYEFDAFDNSHLVHIQPLYVYQKDKNYISKDYNFAEIEIFENYRVDKPSMENSPRIESAIHVISSNVLNNIMSISFQSDYTPTDFDETALAA
ncbi:MAG: hypothetical protein OHK0045_17850 [Raineya sp.]